MSLKFFREKRFQRRHPDVFCQRMALTTPCVSSLRVTPHQILKSFHCSLQLDQLGTSRRKNFSVQSSRSSSRQEVPTFVQTPPGFQTFSRSTAHKDVERLILLPQGSSALGTTDLPAFAECPEALQLLLLQSLLPLLPILFPQPTSRHLSLQGAHSRRSSLNVVPKIRTHTPCSSTVEAFPNVSYPPRLDWFMLDLLRPTLPIPLFAQETVANLTKLG